jgi:hypothetical protein
MKRMVSVVVAGAALILGAASAQAQVTVGVGGGIALPLGDFKDAAKTGWNGIANVGYNTPSGLGVRGDFYYGQHNFKGGIDAKWKLAGGLANVLYNFPGQSSVTPYVMGTVGVMNLKASATGVSQSESKITFGGGAGVKFKAGSDSHIFAEARYLTINTSGSNANFIPINVGVSFGLK